MKNLCIFSLFLSICLLFSASASSHTLWINATDYNPQIYPEFGAKTNLYFGFGHHFPVDDFLSPKQIEEFYYICPRCGKHHNLKPNPGGFLDTEARFKEPGSYIIAAKLKPGFYTMFTEKGKIHHKIGPKTQIKGKVILSLYYEQYAKALVNAGKKDLINFDKTVGHKLEIIPLKNPLNLKLGDFLPVKVLFNGKSARFLRVYATYSGFSTGDDFAYATSTNGEGIAKIRIIHWGVWLIKAEKKLPVPQEWKDKCNQLHYTATLTFEVP
ncbi:DUF4198 domain-containing protein [Candidatus Calescamantes bacterium]|nr:DUF4198 domain-containing protein [Candidatus Calescamantes bacterium]